MAALTTEVHRGSRQPRRSIGSERRLRNLQVAAAATLGAHGATTIQSADQAARALEPLAGRLASVLFAAGIVGTGALAVPVLAGIHRLRAL